MFERVFGTEKNNKEARPGQDSESGSVRQMATVLDDGGGEGQDKWGVVRDAVCNGP